MVNTVKGKVKPCCDDCADKNKVKTKTKAKVKPKSKVKPKTKKKV